MRAAGRNILITTTSLFWSRRCKNLENSITLEALTNVLRYSHPFSTWRIMSGCSSSKLSRLFTLSEINWKCFFCITITAVCVIRAYSFAYIVSCATHAAFVVPMWQNLGELRLPETLRRNHYCKWRRLQEAVDNEKAFLERNCSADHGRHQTTIYSLPLLKWSKRTPRLCPLWESCSQLC